MYVLVDNSTLTNQYAFKLTQRIRDNIIIENNNKLCELTVGHGRRFVIAYKASIMLVWSKALIEPKCAASQ